MIVKQVSVDIEVQDANINLEKLIVDFLESNGFFVFGSTQDDMSEFYNKYCIGKDIEQ